MRELLRRVTSREVAEWMAYYQLLNEEAEEAATPPDRRGPRVGETKEEFERRRGVEVSQAIRASLARARG